MHEPKASASFARDHYLLTSPVMHCQLISKVFSSLIDLRQPQFYWALFRKVCNK